jgi:asparagine synthase (glutamine-hydrolysing)
MCGISGVVCLGERTLYTHNIKMMCDVIAHRGPDDAGYFVAQTKHRQRLYSGYYETFTDEKFQAVNPLLPAIDSKQGMHQLHAHDWNIFFGHRRLAIIDITAAGHQPMSDATKSIWLTYNGEIYNFPEIKKTLIQLGYQFKTHTDTEVIIYAYQEWGIQAIQKFNGMFAFALWDKTNNQFFLVRDRYGIKPVYYTLSKDGAFLFASEIKSILKYNDQSPVMDHEGLLEYFTFQNIFTDKTLYKDIKLLPAGHYIHINLNSDNPSIQPQQYWDFNFKEPEISNNEQDYLEEFDRLFKQAVERQLVSDVEIGSYLSGGMDSGSITAIAAKKMPYLKTFTVGFDLHSASGMELGFDEREKAEHMSYLFKTEHYEMVLKSGDMERCLPNFAWHLEEPRVGQSYPNYYASKLASKFVKVVLAGTGGDELFAGYPWRYYRAVNNDNFEDYIDKYYLFWQRLVDNAQLKKIFSPIWDKVSHVWTRDIFRDVFQKHANTLTRPEDYINHSLYFEAKTFLHGLLVVEDKLSMAHSLETRVPFLDNDLVDFAMQVPLKLKLGNLHNVMRINENEIGDKSRKYFEKTNDGKLILRKALNKYMPQQITQAVKQGFSSPDESWFKGESIHYIRDRLLNPDRAIYQFLDYHTIETLLNNHIEGKENKRLLIWSLLNIEEWSTQLFSQETAEIAYC